MEHTMENRKSLRTREAVWRATKPGAPSPYAHTKRIPEPPVKVKFRGVA